MKFRILIIIAVLFVFGITSYYLIHFYTSNNVDQNELVDYGMSDEFFYTQKWHSNQLDLDKDFIYHHKDELFKYQSVIVKHKLYSLPHLVPDILEFMLEEDSFNVNEKLSVQVPFEYDMGKTQMLPVAYFCNNPQNLNALINHGLKLDEKLFDKFQYIHLWSKWGHVELVKTLLENGAPVDAINDDGMTALLIAAYKGNRELLKLLIDYGANIHHKDITDSTALLLACKRGHLEVVEEILKHKPDLSVRSNGMTAFLEAVNGGHVKIVKELIAAGADLKDKTYSNQSAIDLAKSSEVKKILSAITSN